MCLGIPMKIVKVRGDEGDAEVGGVIRPISLALVKDTRPGDYVIVHAGFAIEKLDEADAAETLRLLRELADETGRAGRERG